MEVKKIQTSLTCEEYEVFSQKAINKLKMLFWRGLLHRSEGIGEKCRYFVRISPTGLKRVKRTFPLMKIINTEEWQNWNKTY